MKQKPDVDPTTLSTFNLGMTDKQREARDSAGLPYTPKGTSTPPQPQDCADLHLQTEEKSFISLIAQMTWMKAIQTRTWTYSILRAVWFAGNNRMAITKRR